LFSRITDCKLQTQRPAEEGIVGKRSIDIESLSLPVFRRWITGTEVIASIVGVGVLAMAVMGATGGTWKASGEGRVEISAASRR
jgi:hypothetical protein